jgi:hypothetical protein
VRVGRWVRAITALPCCCSLGLALAGPARADEKDDLRVLKQEIEAERAALAREREALADQRRRVDDVLASIQRSQAARPAPATELPPVGAPAAKPDGPRLEVAGFAMLDAIHDFDRVDPDWKSSLRPSKIPVNCPGDAGCGNDGETILSVKQSRLGFRGYLPTSLGELRTIFEFELYGVGDDAGETTFRIRHAWGELGSLGAGQTWSLFMDPDVFPDTIEYWGPAGMVFIRNPQLRWTAYQDEAFKLALALEAPAAALDEGKIVQVDPNLSVNEWNKYPDVTAQARWMEDWGHFQAAGMLRWPGFEDSTAPGFEPDGREFGWGVNLSSGIRTVGQDKLLLQFVIGEAISSYMNDGGVDLAPDNALTSAEPVPSLGWLVYYNRIWNEQWTSSIGYSQHKQEPQGGQLGTAFEIGEYLNANLLYHPVPDLLLGPELIWGRRENRDGSDGEDTRVQFSVKYNFAGTILGN